MSGFLRCAALLVLMGSALSAPVEVWAQIPNSQEERAAAFKKLQWQHEGAYHFAASNSTLTLPAGYVLIDGTDARTFYEASNGVSAPSALEAVVLQSATGNIVLFKAVRDGYVRLDDWSDVDADGLLQSMKDGTEQANKERALHNMKPLTIVGWERRPKLDDATKMVNWTIEAKEADEPFLNTTQLRFSRYGYEMMTWVGDTKDDATPFLQSMQAAFAFDAGAQYGDFKPNDKVATYGIAALVAGLLGAKVAAKLGFLAVGLLFLKKGWILALAAISAIGATVRRLRRRNAPVAATTPPPGPDDGPSVT